MPLPRCAPRQLRQEATRLIKSMPMMGPWMKARVETARCNREQDRGGTARKGIRRDWLWAKAGVADVVDNGYQRDNEGGGDQALEYEAFIVPPAKLLASDKVGILVLRSPFSIILSCVLPYSLCHISVSRKGNPVHDGKIRMRRVRSHCSSVRNGRFLILCIEDTLAW